MTFQILQRNDDQEQAKRVEFYNRGENVCEVHVVHLREVFDDESCLEFIQCVVDMYFDFEHSLVDHYVDVSWWYDHVSSIIDDQCDEFRLNDLKS